MPFHDSAGRSLGIAADRLTGILWFLSRHGRYGRAVMLHHHLRERRGDAGFRGRRRPARELVVTARRLDLPTVRRRTVWAAMRWARLTGRLSRNRPGREAVIGAVAAPLAVPAIVLAAGVVAVLLVADAGLWALSTVGGSVRTAVVGPPDDVAASPAPPPFDWTPS